MILISVVIVAYNSQDFLERCIKSILKFLPKNGEVLVVDNASTENTSKILQKFGLKIKLIKSEENLGFGKGNNLAVEQARGEYLFFLNPDTELVGSTFEPLMDFYAKTKNIGIMAPKLIMPNGQTQPLVKELPTVWGAFNEYVLGVKNSYSEYAPQTDQPVEVGMVYGAAMLIKKELFDSVGGFDEKYFMYYEDADLCRKVSKLGKKVYYFPGVVIKHIVGGVKTDLDRYKLNYDSFVKYHGVLVSAILLLIFQIPRLKRRLS